MKARFIGGRLDGKLLDIQPCVDYFVAEPDPATKFGTADDFRLVDIENVWHPKPAKVIKRRYHAVRFDRAANECIFELVPDDPT